MPSIGPVLVLMSPSRCLMQLNPIVGYEFWSRQSWDILKDHNGPLWCLEVSLAPQRFFSSCTRAWRVSTPRSKETAKVEGKTQKTHVVSCCYFNRFAIKNRLDLAKSSLIWCTKYGVTVIGCPNSGKTSTPKKHDRSDTCQGLSSLESTTWSIPRFYSRIQYPIDLTGYTGKLYRWMNTS